MFKGSRIAFQKCNSIKQMLMTFSPESQAKVTVNGWVSSVRKLKNVAFVDITDGSCSKSLMAVLPPENVQGISTGTCLQVSGVLKDSPGKKQSIELQVDKESVKVYGPAAADFPLQKKYHSAEFLRSIPQFRWKGRFNSAVLRYRSFALNQISSYFIREGFTQVQAPIITSSDCEGGGEVFSVRADSDEGDAPRFFSGKDSTVIPYLSVSSQLHLEALASSLSRVWTVTPAFRAEKSDTSRHLSEFWLVEAEAAFIDNLNDLMDNTEQMIRSAIPRDEAAADLLEAIRDDKKVHLVKSRWSSLDTKEPWKRITYSEALDIISTNQSATLAPLEWGDDLSTDHEKYLAGEFFKGPVFITNYPRDLKPFYMKPNGKTVECFDLLFPDIGEVTGGSLREDDYKKLTDRMSVLGMDISSLSWYTDIRKYGSFPHGGYGLGFDRLITYICGIDNIRDAIAFPRWKGHCVC